ncbi:MAG: single-stranded DNA-binding protein [Clostridiales bacterium]|nr:single-stranded DNA-binding protein [Clostridiales bacterium]
MQYELKDNNIINLRGKILSECEFDHEVYGEGFYTFFIKTNRLSDSVDILPVTISERLINSNILQPGNFVEILGQIRSYNGFSDNKNKLILTVFVRDIKQLSETQNKNPNQVTLNGYICKKPIYRTTPFGREITDILLAVNRAYNKSDYIPCISWGRNAIFANKLNVGENLLISGRMQSRIYQKKLENGDLAEKTAYEVSISKIEVLSKKNSADE